VSHRAVVRLVKETNYANLGANEVFLQAAPVSFDASTFEIWGSLLNGARLVLMPPEAPSLSALGEALRRHKVTTLFLTTSLFQVMVDERVEDLKEVRQLLTGGEVMSASHVESYLAAAGSHAVLIHAYGPTENTTFTSTYRLHCGWRAGGKSVPIGQPIANGQVYVLDQQMELAPLGVPGELYVGGAGLAREYLRRPELTAEKFVPDRFSATPGGRLYRTGDQVRWLAEGNLEFIGRIDQQVKLRGFRVELGEIEAVLIAHPMIRESVVVAHQANSGDKRLVAYLVLSGESVGEVEPWREYLGQRLPEYMIPASFMVLSELPLATNGKVDRKRLPAPDYGFKSNGEEYVGPRTPVEELLAGLWCDVFGLERVSVTDNFFELGGHSLLATQAVSRVRKEFGIDLPVRTLFESPTIAQLAELIERAQEKNIKIEETEILPVFRVAHRIKLSSLNRQ
jgi:aspartate racemase